MMRPVNCWPCVLLPCLQQAGTETTEAYLCTLADYLARHGRPVSFYTDKHSIFRVNHPQREGRLTQFGRALGTLDIQLIHANTPQAKDRVERANGTLQDRLVKELRLQGINDIAPANAFVSTFMPEYKRRFAIQPQHPIDAHRPLLHTTPELNLILCRQHTRTLSRKLTFQPICTSRSLQADYSVTVK